MDKHHPDVWTKIVAWIDCGSDYKAVCLIDKLRRNLVMIAHPTADTKFANHLMTLVTMVPDKWNGLWGILGANPNMTEEFVRSYGHLPNLRKDFVFWNDNVSWEFSREYLANIYNVDDAKFFQSALSMKPCVTIDVVKANPDIKWDMYRLSANPTMTWEIVQANPDIEWNICGMARNPNIPFREVVKMAGPQYQFDLLGTNLHYITIEDILANPDFPWHWRSLSSHPNMTFEIIKANNQLPWDHGAVSMNPNVTIATVDANPNYGWDLHGLSMNPNMTWDYVQAHPKIMRYWSILVQNGVIPWEVIAPDDIISEMFNMETVSEYPGLTWKIIYDNPNINWDWESIAHNTFGKK